MNDNTATLKQNASALIQVRGVTRVYKQGEIEVHALRGIDLDINQGEFSALAGPSGSGKTTLLNMIGCLDQPSAGEVFIGNDNVTKLGRTEAAHYRLLNIGFIFQAYNLVPVLTAWENAEFILLLQGVSEAERKKILNPLFDEVGLSEYKHRKPHEMSGGQQQRVAIVRALASKPRIVLADEPTANLDSKTSADLLDLMAELNQSHGVTFLFSTHDQQVMDRTRRIVRLDSGQVVADEHNS